MLKIISWNLAHRPELWRSVFDTDADIGLLQEACEPPTEFANHVGHDREPWATEGAGIERLWRTCIIQLNRRIEMQLHPVRSICDARVGEFAVSRVGTIAAAAVQDPDSGEELTLVSMYAPWERPHTHTASNWIYADASAHRVISDLSIFVGQQRGHRIIAAGDLNILYGHGEHGSAYWATRYQTVFDRMAALGFRFVGPQSPNGRQANPWPDELPRTSLNVPTFRTSQQTPATATRQLDFVFASDSIAERVTARAVNQPDEWGPSDHCRIQIEFRNDPSRP